MQRRNPSLWVNLVMVGGGALSSLLDKEKAIFLDAPIAPKELFGPSVTTMKHKCKLRKKEGGSCTPNSPGGEVAESIQRGKSLTTFS